LRTEHTRWGVTTSALCLAAAGAMLLFAPNQVNEGLAPTGSGNVLAQICGAALFGFAAMNWTARGSALGGIYGRAVVVGNQTHLMIGALLLVTSKNPAARLPAYWALTGLYVFGAAFFTYLMFFSSGLREPRGKMP
jgi:hypothetical protein